MMAKPVLKSLKSRSYRFVVVLLLLCTLLTFNVGRVYRVEAVATTAAVLATSALVAGAVYCGYMALTGASVHLPVDNVDDYLKSIGEKLSAYDNTAAFRNYINQQLYRSGNDTSELVVDFTPDLLLGLYNDFKDVSTLQGIMSFTDYIDVSQISPNGFTGYGTVYGDLPLPSTVVSMGGWSTTFERLAASSSYNLTHIDGTAKIVVMSGSNSQVREGDYTRDVYLDTRNVLHTNGKYGAQYLDQYGWHAFASSDYYRYGYSIMQGSRTNYLQPQYLDPTLSWYNVGEGGTLTISDNLTYPPLWDKAIYDESNDEYLPMVEVSPDRYQLSPQWYNNNDEPKLPWVPFVELPSSDPNSFSGSKWGTFVDDLLDLLREHAGDIIDASLLAQLFNAFKNNLVGSTTYNDYTFYVDNGDEYYFYYSNTYSYDQSVNYNIDITDSQHVIPVDLNSIQEYTDNVYLDTVKSSTLAFGSAIAEYFIFWHNADPVLFYTLCGSFIVILIGAFIGKWGHS